MDALKQFWESFDIFSELITLVTVVIVGLLISPRCCKLMKLPTKTSSDEPE
ncbi:MAG: hypothetical protein AAB631_00825 [Patescibacteria group bacterium]